MLQWMRVKITYFTTALDSMSLSWAMVELQHSTAEEREM